MTISLGTDRVDDVELQAVDQGVVGNRARVGGAAPEGLAVRLAGPPQVSGRNRRERDQSTESISMAPGPTG
jgi:hypothetical protein